VNSALSAGHSFGVHRVQIGGTVQFAPSLFARGPICPESYLICPVVICPRVRGLGVMVRGKSGWFARTWANRAWGK
jgi:hypothetical protein